MTKAQSAAELVAQIVHYETHSYEYVGGRWVKAGKRGWFEQGIVSEFLSVRFFEPSYVADPADKAAKPKGATK